VKSCCNSRIFLIFLSREKLPFQALKTSSFVPTQATEEEWSALQKTEAFLREISFQSTKRPQNNKKQTYLPFSGKALLLSSEECLDFVVNKRNWRKRKGNRGEL